ncbi:hypothetical protein DRP05_03360 [Archaeoglobales archaeon]|nr:MAG: hypothetical protein DRP05_03360 [Archaeoglobales archaeon]
MTLVSSDVAAKMEKLMAEEFKQKYGYHPDDVGLKPGSISKEEFEKMVRGGKIDTNDAIRKNVGILGCGDPNSPPYASSYGTIWIHVFPAKDAARTPVEGSNSIDVGDAKDRFKGYFKSECIF